MPPPRLGSCQFSRIGVLEELQETSAGGRRGLEP